MNIILISECRKKSAIYSRRILSKYARNIARRTWIASITQQGLEHLRHELLNVATKNTAVACHKVVTRDEIVLEWIVGSHKYFDSDGNFAFRYTENMAERYKIELSDTSRQYIKLFSYINTLSGLFHDVGKNFHYFQDKLINRKKGVEAGDPIRHEYLSFLCFFYLWDFKAETYTLQLERLKENIDNFNHEIFQKNISQKPDKHLFNLIFSKDIQKFSLIKVFIHLILSHHRLIEGYCLESNNNEFSIRLKDEEYFNQVYKKLDVEEKQAIFSLYHDQKDIILNEKWKSKTKHVLDQIIKIIANNEPLIQNIIQDKNILMSITHYILRPALIMADQSVSARVSKVKEEERTQKSYPSKNSLANLKDNQSNQNLREHLTWVGSQSYKNNKVLFHSILSNKHLYKVSAPKQLLRPVAKSLPQFQWQDAAVNSIKKNITKQAESEKFGFFGVVMAETGSGKTRANAKIMAALGSEMRFATLLGLRTLTLQTLDEYRDNLAIPKNNIIGIIGDHTTQVLHDLNKTKQKKEQANETELENKESSTLDDLLKEEAQIKISEKGFKDVDTPFPKELDFPNKRDSKLDKISKIPVLVATIDYMIQGIDAGRSSKSRYLSRLMTSDIIIDEIDSYNQNDLMAIHKLAYLVGFYGKKLIISSATLPELLIESFYLAYSTGYQRFKIYTDKPKSALYLGLFTHHSHLNQVSKIESESSQIKAITTPFIDQFYQEIKKEIPKRKASLLDISEFLHQNIKSYDKQYLILSPLYKKIFQQAEQLHEYNHTEIDGIRISTGLIKFNNTVDAFNFSQHLFNEDDLENNAIVKIECYHARHFPIRRNYTEESLSQLLNRKKGKAKKDQFENLSIVKNAIQTAKESNKKQILLLVVSTTIIEIGRDFDFDWGIIEPTSHWSIVQTAGRIMRHRQKDYCHNISLLSHSMKAVRYAKDQRKLYTRPGPESNSEFCLSQTDKYQSVEQLFEYKQLSKKIDASITLKNQATSPMKILENKQIEFFKENQNLGSLHSYLNNPLEYLSKFNSEINPFRGKYQNQFIYCLNEHDQWEVIDKKKKTRLDANDNFDPVEITYPERRLLSQSLDEIEILYRQKGIELEREIYSLSDLNTSKKYHELLGVL